VGALAAAAAVAGEGAARLALDQVDGLLLWLLLMACCCS
jgi:hypothetical protein